MCVVPALAAIGSAMGGLGATAAGATAGAATAATGLQAIGTALAVGGSLVQGINANRMGRAQARALERQARDERNLAAVQESRTRQQFRTAMRKQMAELAARGVSLDSPTSVLLGRTAAQEMSFESQAIRSGGQARSTELTGAARIARGQAQSSLLKGGFSAAGSFLTAAPDLWPELLS